MYFLNFEICSVLKMVDIKESSAVDQMLFYYVYLVVKYG